MIHALLITLLLTTPDPAPLQAGEQQVQTWMEEIDTGLALSEPVWALLELMQAGTKEEKQVRAAAAEMGEGWAQLLSTSDRHPHRVIQGASIALQDESLQLYLQLILPGPEFRQPYLDEFYSQFESNETMRPLLEQIAAGKAVSAELIPRESWSIVHFLLLRYTHYIQFEDVGEANSMMKNMALQELQTNPPASATRRSLLHATLIHLLYTLQEHRVLDELYETVVAMESFPNILMKRNIYWMLDYSTYQTGRIDRSLAIQRNYTIPLSELLGDQQSLHLLLANHGGYLYRLGNYAEAKRVLNATLNEAEGNLDSDTRSNLLNNLSLIYYKTGDNQNYILTQLEALELAKARQDIRVQLNIYRNLHVFYRKNNNRERAREYIEESERLARQADASNELSAIYISRAVFSYSSLNDLEEADHWLDLAGEMLGELDDHRLSVRLLQERANIRWQQNRIEESRNLFQQIREIGLNNQNMFDYLHALANLAMLELQDGRYQSARQHILEFNAHDVSVVDFPMLVRARTAEASLALHNGETGRGLSTLDLVTDLILERASGTADLEGGYWHIEPAYLDHIQLHADILIGMNRYEEALRLLDRFKTINDASLYDSPLVRMSRLSDTELLELNQIQEEIDRLRKTLLITGSEERIGLRTDIANLAARRDMLSGVDQKRRSPYPNMQAVRANLGSDRSILHITRVLDRLYLARIERNHISIRPLPFTESEEELFERAIVSLKSGDTDLHLLHDVYRYLELDKIAAHTRSLTVIPDSYLYQLPLDLLPVLEPAGSHSYGGAEFLVESLSVRYLNSLKELFQPSPRTHYEYEFAGFGIAEFRPDSEFSLMPLPNAPREVTSVGEELSRFAPQIHFLNQEATPEALLHAAPRSRVLHLATHSTLSDSDPLFSRLYLSPATTPAADGSESDLGGVIFAWELFDLNLQTELIVLNSCDSGSGEYLQGAGVMGISRSLRYAGARSLLLNSWVVNDQIASQFATQFYRSLNQGTSREEALRQAKLHFLRSGNANPHYWGPYMLNGDGSALTSDRSKTPIFMSLLVLLAATLIYSGRERNRYPTLP
ncbi:MAG: CHAT domain-containing protein [Balneolaceae bacterium]